MDIFMELFPSMTYEDICEMPFRDFKSLLIIRSERKQKEHKELEAQRERSERKSQREVASANKRFGHTKAPSGRR